MGCMWAFTLHSAWTKLHKDLQIHLSNSPLSSVMHLYVCCVHYEAIAAAINWSGVAKSRRHDASIFSTLRNVWLEAVMVSFYVHAHAHWRRTATYAEMFTNKLSILTVTSDSISFIHTPEIFTWMFSTAPSWLWRQILHTSQIHVFNS